ncbi:MAG: glycosyltransferase family 39 protein [Acidobacteria bacterium]|nr:glycosyltransferase family 39 protein [Acidobacteriota bacterium]
MEATYQAAETPPDGQRTWPVWLLLGFLSLQLMLYTPRMAFFHEEPRRAVIAQEMLLTGDLVVPTVCREPYLKKPPLHNWLIAAVGRLFGGITEWSSRLISVLAFLGVGSLLFFFLRRHEPTLAWPALLIISTNYLMLCEFANKAEPDMLLTACTLAAYVLYMHRPESWLHIVLSGLCLGAGILTKFLSPLFFYPGIILLHLGPHGYFRRHAARLLVHGLVALIPLLSWLALYDQKADVGSLLAGYVQEFTGRAPFAPIDSLRHLVGYPLKITLVLSPWSLALVFGFRRTAVQSDIYRSSRFMFFLALGLFMLAAGARDRYLMPAFPFFAVWCAAHLDRQRIIPLRIQQIVLALLGSLAAFGAVFWFQQEDLLPAITLSILGGALFLAVWRWPPLSVLHFAAVGGLVLFLFYEHGLYYYRAKTMFPFREAAVELSQPATTEYPLVVDEYFSPLRLVFELERIRQQPCRRLSPAIQKPYYFLTIPERIHPAGEILRHMPYAGNYFDTIVLQLVPGVLPSAPAESREESHPPDRGLP